MTNRLKEYGILAIISIFAFGGMFSAAHAQGLLPGTTALADWEREALLCRGQQSELQALSTVGGISNNERAALGIGTSPENDWCLFLSTRLQNNHSHVQGLNPGFAQCLTNFFKAAPGTLTVFSGYRDPFHQARLFNSALERYGSVEAADNWVAPPPCNDRNGNRIQYSSSNQVCRGGSMHNFGLAADIRFNGGTCGSSQTLCNWAHANAAAFGLRFRLGNEPWHIEPVSRDSACATDGQVIPLEGQDSVALEGPTPRPFGEDGAGTQLLEDLGIRDVDDPNTPVQNVFGGLLDSVFGGFGTSSDAEDDENQNESFGYSLGELLGTWFGDFVTQQQPEQQQQPDVATIYYYETTTGTTTLYTVLSSDKEVLATSTISVSEAIEAATVGLDSYLVIHIDDPADIPEEEMRSPDTDDRPSRDSNFFNFQQSGGDNTFTGSYENGDDVFDGSGFGGNTFGSGNNERPVFGAIADWFRNLFGALFGAGN